MRLAQTCHYLQIVIVKCLAQLFMRHRIDMLEVPFYPRNLVVEADRCSPGIVAVLPARYSEWLRLAD